MFRSLFISFFLISSLYSKHYAYDYSICAMFKDDADYLKEWIEFHRLIGFDHFWLYDNGSSDNSLEVLTPYIYQGIVDLVSWPSPTGKSWINVQANAYSDCLHKAKNLSKWLAFIDTDEFIVPVHGKESFKSILSHFEQRYDCGAIVLNWLMFGTSGIYENAPNQTLIETLLMRADTSYGPHQHVKTICRPDRVKIFQIHNGLYHVPYKDYKLDETPNGSSQLTNPIFSPMRIHHYWTRTQKYFFEVKLPRRVIYNGRAYTQDEIDLIEVELNQVQDDTILQYVPELKKRLGIK